MQVDHNLASQWLPSVGYYRLSAYWYPARELSPGGERLDNFQAGTTFADVVKLYEADRKLRTLIHDGMERTEIAMRAQLTDLLCLTPDKRSEAVEHYRVGIVGSSKSPGANYPTADIISRVAIRFPRGVPTTSITTLRAGSSFTFPRTTFPQLHFDSSKPRDQRQPEKRLVPLTAKARGTITRTRNYGQYCSTN